MSKIKTLDDYKELYIDEGVTVHGTDYNEEFDGIIIDVKLDTDNSILLVVEDQEGDVFDVALEDATIHITNMW